MPHNTPSEPTVREEVISVNISTLQIIDILFKKTPIFLLNFLQMGMTDPQENAEGP